jgi:tRNA threonylcarbamoyladenosine biosynthesis protein TsaE
MSSSISRRQFPTGEWTSVSVEETFELGALVGASLTGGEVLLLDGQLGAGKTIFTKGVAFALGLDTDEVTSPSFTLVNHYAEGRLPLYHLDLYRLNAGAAAAHAVDLDELLTDEGAVLIIEWAERMGNYPLPATVWRINIDGDGDDPRCITISPASPAPVVDIRVGGDVLEYDE